jgi:hypothetical protein
METMKMLNVTTKVTGNKLVIEVDLDQEHGISSSGKSMIIASSQGNQGIGKDDIKIGLNVYKPVK